MTVYVGDNLSRETTAYDEHVVMPARTTGKEYGTSFGHGSSSLISVIEELSGRILKKEFHENMLDMR